MGTFRTTCVIENVADRARKVTVQRLLVDTGSELTWIAGRYLEKIGVERKKKDLTIDPARKKLVAAEPLPAG
ncbi:MAG: hypothetical protein ACFB20_09600 [Opitutales bacterium]